MILGDCGILKKCVIPIVIGALAVVPEGFEKHMQR